ncbi:PagK family vesicle-borne virulence factor [Salmonella enterica]|uniref:PagK family vesicle-borne virulence factor n=1 Tax=Salmonella enterica TaxID=28901 RepID=UPI000906E0CD|nr:PagK family vesicle-borne virulence factor [Salmonella enterica]
MRHRVFFPLLLVLSATAFSASAMAASDSPPPPDNTKHASRGWPPAPEENPHQIIQNTPSVAGQTPNHWFTQAGVTIGQKVS